MHNAKSMLQIVHMEPWLYASGHLNEYKLVVSFEFSYKPGYERVMLNMVHCYGNSLITPRY